MLTLGAIEYCSLLDTVSLSTFSMIQLLAPPNRSRWNNVCVV